MHTTHQRPYSQRVVLPNQGVYSRHIPLRTPDSENFCPDHYKGRDVVAQRNPDTPDLTYPFYGSSKYRGKDILPSQAHIDLAEIHAIANTRPHTYAAYLKLQEVENEVGPFKPGSNKCPQLGPWEPGLVSNYELKFPVVGSIIKSVTPSTGGMAVQIIPEPIYEMFDRVRIPGGLAEGSKFPVGTVWNRKYKESYSFFTGFLNGLNVALIPKRTERFSPLFFKTAGVQDLEAYDITSPVAEELKNAEFEQTYPAAGRADIFPALKCEGRMNKDVRRIQCSVMMSHLAIQDIPMTCTHSPVDLAIIMRGSLSPGTGWKTTMVPSESCTVLSCRIDAEEYFVLLGTGMECLIKRSKGAVEYSLLPFGSFARDYGAAVKVASFAFNTDYNGMDFKRKIISETDRRKHWALAPGYISLTESWDAKLPDLITGQAQIHDLAHALAFSIGGPGSTTFFINLVESLSEFLDLKYDNLMEVVNDVHQHIPFIYSTDRTMRRGAELLYDSPGVKSEFLRMYDKLVVSGLSLEGFLDVAGTEKFLGTAPIDTRKSIQDQCDCENQVVAFQENRVEVERDSARLTRIMTMDIILSKRVSKETASTVVVVGTWNYGENRPADAMDIVLANERLVKLRLHLRSDARISTFPDFVKLDYSFFDVLTLSGLLVGHKTKRIMGDNQDKSVVVEHPWVNTGKPNVERELVVAFDRRCHKDIDENTTEEIALERAIKQQAALDEMHPPPMLNEVKQVSCVEIESEESFNKWLLSRLKPGTKLADYKETVRWVKGNLKGEELKLFLGRSFFTYGMWEKKAQQAINNLAGEMGSYLPFEMMTNSAVEQIQKLEGMSIADGDKKMDDASKHNKTISVAFQRPFMRRLGEFANVPGLENLANYFYSSLIEYPDPVKNNSSIFCLGFLGMAEGMFARLWSPMTNYVNSLSLVDNKLVKKLISIVYNDDMAAVICGLRLTAEEHVILTCSQMRVWMKFNMFLKVRQDETHPYLILLLKKAILAGTQIHEREKFCSNLVLLPDVFKGTWEDYGAGIESARGTALRDRSLSEGPTFLSWLWVQIIVCPRWAEANKISCPKKTKHVLSCLGVIGDNRVGPDPNEVAKAKALPLSDCIVALAELIRLPKKGQEYLIDGVKYNLRVDRSMVIVTEPSWGFYSKEVPMSGGIWDRIRSMMCPTIPRGNKHDQWQEVTLKLGKKQTLFASCLIADSYRCVQAGGLGLTPLFDLCVTGRESSAVSNPSRLTRSLGYLECPDEVRNLLVCWILRPYFPEGVGKCQTRPQGEKVNRAPPIAEGSSSRVRNVDETSLVKSFAPLMINGGTPSSILKRHALNWFSLLSATEFDCLLGVSRSCLRSSIIGDPKKMYKDYCESVVNTLRNRLLPSFAISLVEKNPSAKLMAVISKIQSSRCFQTMDVDSPAGHIALRNLLKQIQSAEERSLDHYILEDSFLSQPEVVRYTSDVDQVEYVLHEVRVKIFPEVKIVFESMPDPFSELVLLEVASRPINLPPDTHIQVFIKRPHDTPGFCWPKTDPPRRVSPAPSQILSAFGEQTDLSDMVSSLLNISWVSNSNNVSEEVFKESVAEALTILVLKYSSCHACNPYRSLVALGFRPHGKWIHRRDVRELLAACDITCEQVIAKLTDFSITAKGRAEAGGADGCLNGQRWGSCCSFWSINHYLCSNIITPNQAYGYGIVNKVSPIGNQGVPPEYLYDHTAIGPLIGDRCPALPRADLRFVAPIDLRAPFEILVNRCYHHLGFEQVPRGANVFHGAKLRTTTGVCEGMDALALGLASEDAMRKNLCIWKRMPEMLEKALVSANYNTVKISQTQALIDNYMRPMSETVEQIIYFELGKIVPYGVPGLESARNQHLGAMRLAPPDRKRVTSLCYLMTATCLHITSRPSPPGTTDQYDSFRICLLGVEEVYSVMLLLCSEECPRRMASSMREAIHHASGFTEQEVIRCWEETERRMTSITVKAYTAPYMFVRPESIMQNQSNVRRPYVLEAGRRNDEILSVYTIASPSLPKVADYNASLRSLSELYSSECHSIGMFGMGAEFRAVKMAHALIIALERRMKVKILDATSCKGEYAGALKNVLGGSHIVEAITRGGVASVIGDMWEQLQVTENWDIMKTECILVMATYDIVIMDISFVDGDGESVMDSARELSEFGVTVIVRISKRTSSVNAEGAVIWATLPSPENPYPDPTWYYVFDTKNLLGLRPIDSIESAILDLRLSDTRVSSASTRPHDSRSTPFHRELPSPTAILEISQVRAPEMCLPTVPVTGENDFLVSSRVAVRTRVAFNSMYKEVFEENIPYLQLDEDTDDPLPGKGKLSREEYIKWAELRSNQLISRCSHAVDYIPLYANDWLGRDFVNEAKWDWRPEGCLDVRYANSHLPAIVTLNKLLPSNPVLASRKCIIYAHATLDLSYRKYYYNLASALKLKHGETISMGGDTGVITESCIKLVARYHEVISPSELISGIISLGALGYAEKTVVNSIAIRLRHTYHHIASVVFTGRIPVPGTAEWHPENFGISEEDLVYTLMQIEDRKAKTKSFVAIDDDFLKGSEDFLKTAEERWESFKASAEAIQLAEAMTGNMARMITGANGVSRMSINLSTFMPNLVLMTLPGDDAQSARQALWDAQVVLGDDEDDEDYYEPFTVDPDEASGSGVVNSEDSKLTSWQKSINVSNWADDVEEDERRYLGHEPCPGADEGDDDDQEDDFVEEELVPVYGTGTIDEAPI